METPSTDQPVLVENLRKAFGEQKVLEGVTLSVKKGETLALLGRSGTGKSVLLKIMIALQPADSGTVRLFGQEMTCIDSKQLNEIRKKVGFLFLQAALYDSLTVGKNVEFPLARHSDLPPKDRLAKIHGLLSSVGMEHEEEKMPSQISGGMQKRVGLARALALDPELLLLDEPTAGLDPITAKEIAELIVDLKQKRKITAVVVTHDLRAAKQFADRLLLVDEGRVRAEGTFNELEANQDEFVRQFLESST